MIDSPDIACDCRSTERTAKQKAKLQRGLVREASAAADTMMAINAAARKQL